ncbi:MAG: hypothetical protein ACI974_001117, partial [Paraglaciecola sp.]
FQLPISGRSTAMSIRPSEYYRCVELTYTIH